MGGFNIDTLTYVVPMFIPLWISIYLLSRNPTSAQNRLTSLTIFTLFGYLLFGAVQTNIQDNLNSYIFVQRLFIWTINSPGVLWVLLAIEAYNNYKRENWLQKLKVFSLVYLAVFILCGLFTNLIFDYSRITLFPNTLWPIRISIGILYLPNVLILLGLISVAAFLFFRLSKSTLIEAERGRFTTLVLGSISFFTGGLYLSVNIYFQLFLTELPGILLLLLGIGVIIFGSIRYKGIKEDSPLLLDKDFISSSVILLVILVLYLVPALVFQSSKEFGLIMLLVSLIILVPFTHSLFDWSMSYARNIFTLKTLELPLATDEEAAFALRNLNRPEKLEESSLKRLKTVGKDSDQLDSLRELIRNAIQYFEPNELKRNRLSLKYEILKMISDQVEEGQILWDLGFEEYPLEIAEKSDGQKPRLPIQRPTDYQATSRNAFISLKKEAIHDLAWRISYLEKHYKS